MIGFTAKIAERITYVTAKQYYPEVRLITDEYRKTDQDDKNYATEQIKNGQPNVVLHMPGNKIKK